MSLLDVNQLTKKYGEFTAVDHVSFRVNAGEIVALIGSNGAGKTSMMKCLSGSISVTEGWISYRTKSLLKDRSLRNEFGFLIQANFFEYLNAYDNLDILLRLYGRHGKENKLEVMRLLNLVGLEDKKNKYVKTFSFGMKQRLGLAQALIYDPHFLVLDEPFVGLDPVGKNILKKVILDKAKKEEAGILFSSHDLEDVTDICDRVIMLKKGKIIYDDVFQAAKRYRVLLLDDSDTGKLENRSDGTKIINGTVIFDNFGSFQRGYQEMKEKGIRIKDIETQEDNLYQFFEGGGWNGDPNK